MIKDGRKYANIYWTIRMLKQCFQHHCTFSCIDCGVEYHRSKCQVWQNKMREINAKWYHPKLLNKNQTQLQHSLDLIHLHALVLISNLAAFPLLWIAQGVMYEIIAVIAPGFEAVYKKQEFLPCFWCCFVLVCVVLVFLTVRIKSQLFFFNWCLWHNCYW